MKQLCYTGVSKIRNVSNLYCVLKRIFEMTSILTNTAAMGALQSLRTVNMQLDDTQNRISSGMKVSSAKDSPAYWSIATTMRSDSSTLTTVSDALGLGAAITDTAYQGLSNAIDIVTQIKGKLTTAKEPGVDKSKINAEISSLKSQLFNSAAASSFNSQNWLYNSSSTAPGTKEIVGSFNRDSSGVVSIGSIAINTANTILVDTNSAARGLLTKSVQATNIPVSTGSTTTTTAVYFLINANSTTAAAAIGVNLPTKSLSRRHLRTLISLPCSIRLRTSLNP